jgi:hypothetical protein
MNYSQHPTQSVDIVDFGELDPSELIEIATMHELYAAGIVDRWPSNEGEVGFRQTLHRDFVPHYAGLGLLDYARLHAAVAHSSPVLGEGSGMSMQFALYEASGDEADLDRAREISLRLSDRYTDYPLRMIRYDMQQGREIDPQFIACIENPFIRTAAKIITSSGYDEALQLRRDFVIAYHHQKPVNKRDRVVDPLSGIEVQLAKLDLYSAATHSNNKAHRLVIDSLKKLYRPDVVRGALYEYVDVLIDADNRAGIKEIAKEIDRPNLYRHGHFDVANLYTHVAERTRSDKDISHVLKMTVSYPENSRISYVSRMAAVAAERGDYAFTSELAARIPRDNFFAGYELGLIGSAILPRALDEGDIELAKRAYRMSNTYIGPFVTGRLLIARYTRNTAALQVEDDTTANPDAERTRHLRGWLAVYREKNQVVS